MIQPKASNSKCLRFLQSKIEAVAFTSFFNKWNCTNITKVKVRKWKRSLTWNPNITLVILWMKKMAFDKKTFKTVCDWEHWCNYTGIFYLQVFKGISEILSTLHRLVFFFFLFFFFFCRCYFSFTKLILKCFRSIYLFHILFSDNTGCLKEYENDLLLNLLYLRNHFLFFSVGA